MEFSELEKYKVAVMISGDELKSHKLTVDDIIERNSKGWEFLRTVKSSAIEYSGYEWPGCAYSMEMKLLPQDAVLLIFSETVSDFVLGLKNSQKIANHGSILLRELINRIEATDEDGARHIIRDFEKSMQEIRE